MSSAAQRLVGSLAGNWRPFPYGQVITWRYRRTAPLHRGTVVCFVRAEQSARAAMLEAVARVSNWCGTDLEARVAHALRAVLDVTGTDRYIIDFDSGVAYLPVSATTIELQNAHVREEAA